MPAEWRPRLQDQLLRTATARYIYYRWQARPQLWWERLVRPAYGEAPRYQANIDVESVLSRMPDIVAATDHLVRRMTVLARSRGQKLLIAMDGNRGELYAGLTGSSSLILNRLIAEITRDHSVPFVDLHAAFAADWQANKRRLDFLSDSHWNERGHFVAARAIAEAIRSAQ